MLQATLAEYIWIDGGKPTASLRSKTKVLNRQVHNLADLPEWGFDGSSTMQADGNSSDCLLRPVSFVKDPIRGGNNVLVMCEVFNADGTVHESNHRAHLREVSHMYSNQEPLFGIEQEYVFMKDGRPLGFPENGYPAPQGPYYCSVGAGNVAGREIVEEHLKACLEAGIGLSGINAEVLLGQWEFQVGALGPLEVSDHLWLARWILARISEKYGVTVDITNKPMKGDWNGSGAHTNFSTKAMREEGGLEVIKQACEKIGRKVQEHISVYGDKNDERLTGRHETCSINEFKYGVSDRGASIRIPMQVNADGKGYLEDRRPGANIDPYQVCSVLIKTVCGNW